MDGKDAFNKHQKYNKTFWGGIIVLGLIFFSPFIFMIINAIFGTNIQYPNEWSFFLTYGIGIVLFFVILDKVGDHTKDFKDAVVRQELEKVFSDLTFEHEYIDLSDKSLYINQKKFKIPSFNFIDEYFKGTYKGKQIEVYDVSYIDRSDNNSRTFNGIWCVFDFYKEISESVYVCYNNFIDSERIRKNDIDLEDIDFSENHIISADKEEEAFYVLTPKIIEIIKNIEQKMGKEVCIIFESNKMHVVVDRVYDFLDVRSSKNNYEQAVKDINLNILTILQIADEIEEDKELFKSKK